MFPAGFKPTVAAGERLQKHASDRAANGIGYEIEFIVKISATFL
jgi:hypothetical protein